MSSAEPHLATAAALPPLSTEVAAVREGAGQPEGLRSVCVLCCRSDVEGGLQGVPEEWRPLFEVLESRGMRVHMVDWEELARRGDPARGCDLVLPLLAWDYSERPLAFRHLVQQLVQAHCEPQADLRAIEWVMHKRYLVELAEVGVPVVPTRLLCRRADVMALHAAMESLGGQCRERTSGRRVYVSKPAIGSRGDDVELLVEGDSAAESLLVEALQTRDFLLQPFLGDVRREGEICVVFVNGEILHSVLKDPAGWGSSTSSAEEPRRSSCQDGTIPHNEPAGRNPVQHPSPNQPVHLLDPIPPAALAAAEQTMAFLQARFAAESTAGTVFIARVDLLPLARNEWLVSEIEPGWGNLFLRARSDAAAVVATALEQHIRSHKSVCGRKGYKRLETAKRRSGSRRQKQ
ncbi:hypothetical protein AB1Y20_002258 [Prymnesium parvum]|uniref:Inositol-1,3,4-trisphosphate 5/6-kinase n=1 Tax=Prymnesium parvum TaxID=97485 RepID=A0AB34JB73_PRYPA